MKRAPDIFFWTAAAGMELSWMYAWAAFLMSAAAGRPYPLPEATLLFAGAAAATALTRGRGWRVVSVLALHLLAWILAALRGVQVWWYPGQSFWDTAWLADLFSGGRAAAAWYVLALFMAWTLVFWIWGFRFVRRTPTYPQVCSRFDQGLAWLFGLLLLKLFLRIQIGIRSAETLSEAMIFPFFVFALPAVALARNRSGSRRQFMTGYRGFGLMLSFSVGALFCGAGLVLFFRPYLRAASEIGYAAVKATGRWISPILLRILIFIFGYGPRLPAGPDYTPKPGAAQIPPQAEPSRWTEFFLKIYLWFFYVLLALLFALFVAVGAWYLGRWLLSRTPQTARGSGAYGRFLQWLEGWMSRLQAVYAKWLARRRAPASIRLYVALLRWGRRSGLANRIGETPLEYGKRLKAEFERAAAEIDRIVAVFNRYVYGGVPDSAAEVARARRSLRKLSSPRLWPKRLKLWFLSG